MHGGLGYILAGSPACERNRLPWNAAYFLAFIKVDNKEIKRYMYLRVKERRFNKKRQILQVVACGIHHSTCKYNLLSNPVLNDLLMHSWELHERKQNALFSKMSSYLRTLKSQCLFKTFRTKCLKC